MLPCFHVAVSIVSHLFHFESWLYNFSVFKFSDFSRFFIFRDCGIGLHLGGPPVGYELQQPYCRRLYHIAREDQGSHQHHAHSAWFWNGSASDNANLPIRGHNRGVQIVNKTVVVKVAHGPCCIGSGQPISG